MSKSEVKKLQRGLNIFTKKYLEGIAPLLIDGRMGHATKSRIKMVKFYLGYLHPADGSGLTSDVTHTFKSRLWHPKSLRYSTPARIRRGMERRSKQRKNWKKNHQESRKSGVGRFDGRPCANWMIPYLRYARARGWRGTLNSGWRDPKYSESLCYSMCGRPSCSGRCAGRNSNHSGSTKPRGAVDVSDYYTFGRIMEKCPYSPRIWNGLGRRDPVHFSASGN